MNDSFLLEIYQLFILLLDLNLIVFLTLYSKPKFIFNRLRMISEEKFIPKWVYNMSLINLT
ncbi:MAG: hypothetical protein HN576_07315 [Bacteriovoracaceae bacterium]|nr:hypothetical protein [Bacteriovoracaceae bacterium]